MKLCNNYLIIMKMICDFIYSKIRKLITFKKSNKDDTQNYNSQFSF